MKRQTLWLGAALAWAALLLAATGSHPASPAPVEAPAKAAECSGPRYHQFDFWIGDWDGFDRDHPGVLVARNRVSRILGGCVVLEDYRSLDGVEGESFSLYDRSRKVWHQTWVTSQGKLLVIEGQFQAGEMVMTGTERGADGREQQVRGVWKPVEGGVGETAVTSPDGGKTWRPWFDMIFRPHKP